MGCQLRESLIDLFGVRDGKFKEYSFGWIKEKEAYTFVQPSHHRKWCLRDFRPFLVYKTYGSYVYFCLFSTSKLEFRCEKDFRYGIENNTPVMFFENCFIKNSKACRSLKGGSRLFKRMLDFGKCKILLRMNQRQFQKYATICGFCEQSKVPERIRSILQEEFKEWNQDDSEN